MVTFSSTDGSITPMVPFSSVPPSRDSSVVTVASRDLSFSLALSSSAPSDMVPLPPAATTPSSKMLSFPSTSFSASVSLVLSTLDTMFQATLVFLRTIFSFNSTSLVPTCHSSVPTPRRASRCVSHGFSPHASSRPLSLLLSRDTLNLTTCTTCSSNLQELVFP